MQSHAAGIKQLFGPEKLPRRSRNNPLERHLLTTGPVCTNKDQTLKKEAFSPSKPSYPHVTGDFSHRKSWFSKTVSKVAFFLKMPTRIRSAPAPCYLFCVWTEEKGGFGMSYIILITAHALWGMLSYIHYLLFKNFRVDRRKRFQNATCGCVFFFFIKNGEKESSF